MVIPIYERDKVEYNNKRTFKFSFAAFMSYL